MTENDTERDIWTMLEETAPDGCEAIQDLYSWSLNFDPGKLPFALFLDMIGWSDDNLGEPIFSLPDVGGWNASLGYLELSKLALALTAYADRPQDVRAYVDELMAVESES